MNWIDKLAYIKTYLPKMLIGDKRLVLDGEDKVLEKSKENLLKLEKGIREINSIIVNVL
jgi:hypothetical protein